MPYTLPPRPEFYIPEELVRAQARETSTTTTIFTTSPSSFTFTSGTGTGTGIGMGTTNLRTKLNLSTGIGKFNVLKRKGSAAAAAKALRTKLAGVGGDVLGLGLGLESENGNGTSMSVGGEIGLGIGISGEIGIVGGGGTIRGRKKKGGRGQVRKGEAVVGSVDYNSRVVGRMTRGRDGSVRVRKSTKVKTKVKAKRVDENENANGRMMGAGGGGVDAITNSGGCCVGREGEGGGEGGEDKTLLSKLGAQAGKRRVVLLESLNLNLNADGLKEVRRRLSLNLHPAKRRGEGDENNVDSPMEVSDASTATSSGGRRGLSRRATGSTSSLRLLYRKFEKGGNGL
ncbi:hypothetical protein PNOK_0308300 [Pyrrhoderma noxium]|uniref:Uncharacterized protein n=1 Tax=Pyrrhoderma noxium TaxID=2282107 RepID=A0A286ULF3_9AGAM|nr:hypothetical protein PNOK_0308300 [Pyrrhoderma noxium]